MNSFRDKTVLVVGASRGIGLHIANSFILVGAHVIACSRFVQASFSPQIDTLVVDVLDEHSVHGLFMNIAEYTEKIDIVVNAVGGAEPFGNLMSLSDEDWMHTFSLNCMGVVRITRYAVPFLEKANGGSIVNIASVSAHQPGINNPHYITAKAGLIAFSKYCAQNLAHKKIRTNVVCPSTIRGGVWEQNVEDRARRIQQAFEITEQNMIMEEEAKAPVGRMGSLPDISNAILFLASDQSSFINGVCLNVDGGISRSIL